MHPDSAQMLSDAETAATEIMDRDKAAPGFAIAVMRAVIKRLPPDAAARLIGMKKPAKPKLPIDPAAMIG